jgi:hypothetical protein
MTGLARWYLPAALALSVVLVLSAVSSSAGGQAPDERDALIARQQALIDDQETLIVAQESLLNEYRCRFGIDTHLVPNGCHGQAQPGRAPTATSDPAAMSAPTATADPTTLPPIPVGTTQAQWDHLVQCESRGDYTEVNPVGPYLGAFQFLQSTWDWVAGIHYPLLVGVDPRNASPAEQHRMAYALYGMQGWRPWPACTAAFRQ